MPGGVSRAAAVSVASFGWLGASGPASGSGERRGASFAGGFVGLVGGAGGCGDATGASGTASVGVADTAWGVAGNEVSDLASASAVFSRCKRAGRVAAGSVMPVSGDMSSPMCWENAETSSSRVLGSQSLTGVLRTAQAGG